MKLDPEERILNKQTKQWPAPKKRSKSYCTICRKSVPSLCEDTDSCDFYDDWPE